MRSLLKQRRRVLFGVAGLVLLALIVGSFVSWNFSSRVLVPEHPNWPEDIRVEAVSEHRVVLERTEDSERPGFYGLGWQSGHAIVGPIVAGGDVTVTRRLSSVRGYLVPEQNVALGSIFIGNPRETRGLPFRTVSVEGELGPMPAWYIPSSAAPASPGSRSQRSATSDTWAIIVHGINDDPQVGLRIAPALKRAGLDSLSITYREDRGAPESPDGFHHMGLTEWRDLQAAARYATAQGARRLVLIGFSMGGSLVTQFMQHSSLASRVDGLVLDAPALSWQDILAFNATEMGLPSAAAKPVEWAVGARIPADWNDLNALRHTEDLELPILLFHGTADSVVPIETSEKLAEEIPRWVTYYRVPDAEHTLSWNVDPALYERRLRRFLDRALG